MRLKTIASLAIEKWFIGKSRTAFYPALVGVAVFFAYPSLIGYQDVASLMPEPVAQRWLAYFPQMPGQTAKIAHVAGLGDNRIDDTVTGSVPVAENVLPTSIRIASEEEADVDPQRINRVLKGDRVVSTPSQQPPARFTAGSVIERHSMLEPMRPGGDVELAFVERRPLREAIEVASLFHAPSSEPDIDTDLPVMVASLVRESAGNVLAYGEEENAARRSPFAAVLNPERPINLIPKLGDDDHPWAAQPLPLAAFGEQEQNCLAAGIYFEARGEPVRGQAAVSQVILNRVKNPAYPDSICGVVYQNKKWRNRCQFSFACDGIRERVNDPKRWELAKYVARETTEGRIWLTQVGSSTHYHATYVRPKWARSMKKVGRIGLHIFYRTFGGGWS